MDRLDFSTLWLNERWSDVTLIVRPRGSVGEKPRDADGSAVPSSSAPSGASAERRVTRSMVKGVAAARGRRQGKALASSPTAVRTRSSATQRATAPSSGAVKASRGSRIFAAGPNKAGSAATFPDAEQPCPGKQFANSAKTPASPAMPEGAMALPAHAAVLISTSEYFKRYFESWHPEDGGKLVAIEVEPEEMAAAKLMLRYMYTGRLPADGEGADPSQLLRMLKLADQFSVNRFLATCNTALAEVPLERLTLDHVATILALPPFLLEGGALTVARRRAEEKLAQMFGDLEGAWFDPGRRQEFLRLPFPAVKFLLGRTETAVYNENTAVVALTDWIVQNTDSARGAEAAAAAGGNRAGSSGSGAGNIACVDAAATAGPGPSSTAAVLEATAAAADGSVVHCGLTEAQLDELFALIRLPSLSSAYMSLLPYIGWIRRRLTPQLLVQVLQLVKADQGSGGNGGGGGGQRGDGGGGRSLGCLYSNGALELLQRMTGPMAVPRAMPERTALELEWTIHRSDVQALIAECRAEDCPQCPRGAGGGAAGSGQGGGGEEGCCPTIESTRLFSEPAYYYAGFYWRMCFFVQKKIEPKRRRLGDMADVSGGGAGGPGAGAAAGAGGGAGGAHGGGGVGVDGHAAAADAGGGGGAGGRLGVSGGRDGSSSGEVAVYHDFLGVTCRAVLGGEEFAPLTSMNLELLAARFNALGEQLPSQRAEVPGYIDDEVPYGVYDFFRQDNLADASQLAPFVCRRNMLHLSCKITRCS